MKKGVVITLPKSDDVTEYFYFFSKPIIDACIKYDVDIRKIEKHKVNRVNVEKDILSYDHNFIIFNGHGSTNSIHGHGDEMLIKKGTNENILKNRIVYVRACWASLELGPSINKGKKDWGCFIGYDLEFGFWYDQTRIATPSKDTVAKVFFDTSNLIPIGLIKGQTAKQANENSKKAMLKSINKLLSKPDGDSQVSAQVLWDNYSGQVLIGNPDYKI